MTNVNSMSSFKKFFEAYEAVCKPYCQELGLSVQAFEILMYIARHEGIATAGDICKEQNIKPTLMSFHIEKLVQAGYVERQTIDGNRRSIKLVCTPAARPILENGARLSARFSALLWEGVTKEERESLFSTMKKIGENAQKIIDGNV